MTAELTVAQLRAIQADCGLARAREALEAARVAFCAAEDEFELRWTAGLDDDEKAALNAAYGSLRAAA